MGGDSCVPAPKSCGWSMGPGQCWTCSLDRSEDVCATNYTIFLCVPELNSRVLHTRLSSRSERLRSAFQLISACPQILRSRAWGQVGVSKPGDQVNLFMSKIKV